MPILSWYEEKDDIKLMEMTPALKMMSEINDVRPVILQCTSKDNVFDCEKAVHMCDKLIKEQRSASLLEHGGQKEHNNSTAGD